MRTRALIYGFNVFALSVLGCKSPGEPTTTFWRVYAEASNATDGCFLQVYFLLPDMQTVRPWEGRAQIGFLRARGGPSQWEHVADTTLRDVVVRVEFGSADSIRVLFSGPPADTLSGLRSATNLGGTWKCDARWPASPAEPLTGRWSLFLDLPD